MLVFPLDERTEKLMSSMNLPGLIHQSTDRPPRPRISAANTEFATVIVGHERKEFTVHKDLLTHYSDFFRAALTGQFREAQDNTVTLPKDQPLDFEVFVHWLYYQRFPHKGLGDDADLVAQITLDDGQPDADIFVYQYVFADKYKVEQLKNDSINGLTFAVQDHAKCPVPSPDGISYAFDSLDQESPMCRLIVELVVRWLDPFINNEFESYDNISFLQSLWKKYALHALDRTVPKYASVVNVCDFHEHKNDEEWAMCESDQMRIKCLCNELGEAC